MQILDWYEPYSWITQLLIWGVIIYTYFRNKNKPVDPVAIEKAQWYRTAGMTMIVLVMVSSCITAIFLYDDNSRRDRLFGLMTIIFFSLFTITCLYIEYHFRRQKKLSNNQLETKEDMQP
jgi:cytochrome bd-type quinol oxidase subunit 2